MLWDLIDRKKLRRALLYLLYILLCLLVQDSIFASLPLFGVNMLFLPAAAVAIGMLEDGIWGAAFGLVLGFLADISYNYTALFVAVFPVLGFFAGILSRWLVNKRFFAYMLVCTAGCVVTAAAQMFGLLLKGHEFGSMLWTAIVQVLWSLPMTAALYFPCKAIARKKI